MNIFLTIRNWFKWRFGYYKCYLINERCHLKAGSQYYYYEPYFKRFDKCVKNSANTTSLYDLKKHI